MTAQLEQVRAAALAVCQEFAPRVELTAVSEESEGRFRAFIRVRRSHTMSDEAFWPIVQAVAATLERVPGIAHVYHEVQVWRDAEGTE